MVSVLISPSVLARAKVIITVNIAHIVTARAAGLFLYRDHLKVAQSGFRTIYDMEEFENA